jgi:biopolymer transport protein ExbD
MRGFVRDDGGRTLRPQRSGERRLGDDALVPLINMVFILLLFFMLAGTIRPPDPLPIERPMSIQGQLEDAELVELWMDADGQVALGQTVMPLDTLIDDLRLRIAAGGATRILLSADDDLPTGQLRTLMRRLRELGVRELLIVARQG